MTRTLLLIFAFIALMVGSFIWFVATWDASKEDPIGFIWPNKLPPEGRSAPNPVFSVENQRHSQNALKSAISDPYQTHTGPIPNPYGVS